MGRRSVTPDFQHPPRGSKSNSTQDPSYIGPVARQIIMHGGQASSRWCGAEVWRGHVISGVVLVIRPRFKTKRSVPKYPRFTSKTRP
ncbi:hypothetical protein AVEN_106202-1 [Araneus ventricosus]|uniref:Uncharacterized protein n=1 Tax=Araneus ventricosus TaxID=182803 RepID=A0A4Y2QTD5_ARAVE|nr:hypothetical protein AVEN_232196-1 [Araneus ventricosus]GBN66673.1 hypothetical protein AVEN_106202-1 [Araneus ventricosus]